MKRRTLLSLLAAAPAGSLLTACGGGTDTSVSLRMLNASPGYASLDLWVDDERELSAVTYGAVSSFRGVPEGDVTTTLTRTGSSTSLLEQSRSLDSGTDYTVIAYGWEGGLKSVIVTEEEDEPDSGETRVSVYNTAPDAGTLDIYLTADDDLLDEATPIATDVEGEKQSAFGIVDSGTYRLRVTAAGDTEDLLLDITGLQLPSKKVVTLVVTSGPGGVLVNVLMLEQGGAVTPFMNPSARVRVVAASTDNAVVSATINGVAVGGSARASSIGSYVLMPANSAALVAVTANSQTTTLTQAIVAGSDVTLLVYGSAAEPPRVSVLNDDNRLPTDDTKFKIRLVHALTGEPDTLTLTLDFTAVASGVAYGSSSAFSSETALTDAQLAVTTPLQTDPLYSAVDVSLEATGVYTFFMMGSTSVLPRAGVLRRDR